jgi:GTP-binding protein
MSERAPLVAIVGRPNVGKSALFNRLTRSRGALVEDLPGTTRDRIYGRLEWRGRRLQVVDTGGLADADEDPFAPLVREGIAHALEEAAAAVLVVDGSEPLTSADYEAAELLRRSGVPVLVVANKADRSSGRDLGIEAHALGLGEPLGLSAYHGTGVGELLDAVLDLLPEAPSDTEEESQRPIRVAIVGRPNVGKSSLVNAILGESRVIVSDVPGTTRDAVDTPFLFEGRSMLLIDTAGIRRRGRVERGVERHSVQRAQRAIDRADVVVLVIDQGDPLVAQDAHIAGYAQEHSTGLVLAVAKWDLVPEGIEPRDVGSAIDRRYHFVPWAPVLVTSSITGEGVRDLLEIVSHVAEVRRRRVQTSELNLVLRRAVSRHAPPSGRTKRLRLLYATQAEVEPPTFVLFVNDPTLVHFSYQRYLENRIREAFDFAGTGIRLVFRARPNLSREERFGSGGRPARRRGTQTSTGPRADDAAESAPIEAGR